MPDRNVIMQDSEMIRKALLEISACLAYNNIPADGDEGFDAFDEDEDGLVAIPSLSILLPSSFTELVLCFLSGECCHTDATYRPDVADHMVSGRRLSGRSGLYIKLPSKERGRLAGSFCIKGDCCWEF